MPCATTVRRNCAVFLEAPRYCTPHWPMRRRTFLFRNVNNSLKAARHCVRPGRLQAPHECVKHAGDTSEHARFTLIAPTSAKRDLLLMTSSMTLPLCSMCCASTDSSLQRERDEVVHDFALRRGGVETRFFHRNRCKYLIACLNSADDIHVSSFVVHRYDVTAWAFFSWLVVVCLT